MLLLSPLSWGRGLKYDVFAYFENGLSCASCGAWIETYYCYCIAMRLSHK